MLCWVWLPWPGAALSAPIPAPTHHADGKWITDWLVLNTYLSSGEHDRLLKEVATNRSEPVAGPTGWRDAAGRAVAWRRVAAGGKRFNVRATVGPDYSGKTGLLNRY